MTDHDPTDHDPNRQPDRDAGAGDQAADDRIDALARAAGSELRRPAPADGIARVQRTTRQRQAVRAGAAGVAAVAIIAVGAIAIGGRDGDETLVPATVTTVDSTVPESTLPPETVPETTPDETPDTTVAPPGTAATTPPTTEPVEVLPNAAGDPDVVYVAQEFGSFFGSEVATVDPRTGEVLSTFVVDDAASEASRAAQDALVGTTSLRREFVEGRPSITSELRIGEITYRHATLPSEAPTIADQDPADLPFYDRCQQAEVIVEGAAATALPERARSIVASPDGRRLAVVAGDCPVEGTLVDQVASGSDNVDGFAVAIEVFDAARPDLPGSTVLGDLSPFDLSNLSFSADGRFLAVESFGAPSLRVFDLDDGTELNPAAPDDDCSVQGTKWSRFVGPWIGGTSLALVATCPGETRLVIYDVATGVIETRVVPGGPAEGGQATADVDREHFDRPETAWFTLCRFDTSTCWIGQGAGPLVELPGSVQASFLPLGFEYGG